MFFKKLFDPWIHLRKPELRTLREQMMLDLKVEIRHPPVGEKMTFDIHGVFAGVFRPSQLKIEQYFCFLMNMLAAATCPAARYISQENPKLHPMI